MSNVERINAMGDVDARATLQKCCAAPTWTKAMLDRRPFADEQTLSTAAAEIWWSLDRDEWLAAFAGHPKIGDVNSLRKKYANTTTWAASEQAGVVAANEHTLQSLANYNRQYEERFGYIFIICATGKSADEMLALLQERLKNGDEAELRIAAGEQLKITLLRLKKLDT